MSPAFVIDGVPFDIARTRPTYRLVRPAPGAGGLQDLGEFDSVEAAFLFAKKHTRPEESIAA